MATHGPATDWKADKSASLKRVLGLWMVTLYTLVYAGFVFINVVSPDFMGIDVGTFNMAIAYGFVLILLAVFLAVIYNEVCTHAEELMDEEAQAQKGGKA
jgi:uncharacterized membrane protein (DUF485 family)